MLCVEWSTRCQGHDRLDTLLVWIKQLPLHACHASFAPFVVLLIPDELLRMRPEIECSQYSCRKDFFASHERDAPDVGEKFS